MDTVDAESREPRSRFAHRWARFGLSIAKTSHRSTQPMAEEKFKKNKVSAAVGKTSEGGIMIADPVTVPPPIPKHENAPPTQTSRHGARPGPSRVWTGVADRAWLGRYPDPNPRDLRFEKRHGEAGGRSDDPTPMSLPPIPGISLEGQGKGNPPGPIGVRKKALRWSTTPRATVRVSSRSRPGQRHGLPSALSRKGPKRWAGYEGRRRDWSGGGGVLPSREEARRGPLSGTGPGAGRAGHSGTTAARPIRAK